MLARYLAMIMTRGIYDFMPYPVCAKYTVTNGLMVINFIEAE